MRYSLLLLKLWLLRNIMRLTACLVQLAVLLAAKVFSANEKAQHRRESFKE